MNRWLWIGSLAALLMGSTGCMQHSLRSGGPGCASASCDSGCDGCGNASCGGCGGSGLLGKLCNECGTQCNDCGNCRSGVLGRLGGLCGFGCQGCRPGCVAGPFGWQQGGLDYSSHLQPGVCGHGAGQRLNSLPFTPGPPTAQVGYPYYTVRGPRDFLAADPPTIGR